MQVSFISRYQCLIHLLSPLVFFLFLSFANANQLADPAAESSGNSAEENPSDSASTESESVPVAENIDLQQVIVDVEKPPISTKPEAPTKLEEIEDAKKSETDEELEPAEKTSIEKAETEEVLTEQLETVDEGGTGEGVAEENIADESSTEEVVPEPDASRVILGVKVPPATATRLNWAPVESFGELTVQTPVLVVNGSSPGKTLCLVAAVHGDELNGIEMIRRVVYDLDPEKLTGTVIGVPIVNLPAFRRGSRYLPDRRDLNRYFPGNSTGSGASRMANSFFTEVVHHCNALVDLHTGSFYRTNLPQLRADLTDPSVLELSQSFGAITVLNSQGHPGSLRAAAVRAGIPAVTMEAGEPMRLQSDVVAEGTKAIDALMHKMGMYSRLSIWSNPTPAYYRSHWVRADQSGFLFSTVTLGKRVTKGEVLGRITDPITNQHIEIVSPYRGRVLGMALDQMVLPGFAAYHIGIQRPEAVLSEETPEQEEEFHLDESNYDDALLPNANQPNAETSVDEEAEEGENAVE